MNIDTLTNASLRLFGSRRFSPIIGIEPPEWADSALCAQVDADLWYPEKGASPTDAKLVCAHCPVRRDCLETAMATEPGSANSRHGVWGGLSPNEREQLGLGGWTAGDPLPPISGASTAHRSGLNAPEPEAKKKENRSKRSRPCPLCGTWLADVPRHRRLIHGEVAA